MSIRQVSVFLENRPGTLQGMTQVLSDAGINLRAFSLAESTEFGIARMIADDAYETSRVLKEAGYVCSLTPVLAVEIPDVAGGLHKVLTTLTDAGVNVEYMYASLGDEDKAYMIFRVTEGERAESVLTGKGFYLIEQDSISEMQ